MPFQCHALPELAPWCGGGGRRIARSGAGRAPPCVRNHRSRHAPPRTSMRAARAGAGRRGRPSSSPPSPPRRRRRVAAAATPSGASALARTARRRAPAGRAPLPLPHEPATTWWRQRTADRARRLRQSPYPRIGAPTLSASLLPLAPPPPGPCMPRTAPPGAASLPPTLPSGACRGAIPRAARSPGAFLRATRPTVSAT